jgi:hypothetical protein
MHRPADQAASPALLLGGIPFQFISSDKPSVMAVLPCMPTPTTHGCSSDPDGQADQQRRALGVRSGATVCQLPPDPGMGSGHDRMARRVTRLVRGRAIERGRARAAPTRATTRAPHAGVPRRRTSHRLDRRPERLDRPACGLSQGARRVRDSTRSPSTHQRLECHPGQGGHRRPRHHPAH